MNGHMWVKTITKYELNWDRSLRLVYRIFHTNEFFQLTTSALHHNKHMILRRRSKNFQHIQQHKDNLHQWMHIKLMHWSYPKYIFSYIWQIFPHVSAPSDWDWMELMDTAQMLWCCSKYWQKQLQRVTCFHCHPSSFSLIRKPSTTRCFY